MFGDALELRLDDLEPLPTKLVANLPYSIATPLCVESLDGLPSIHRWCVMLQREVADRFVAPPGSRSYGAVSVLDPAHAATGRDSIQWPARAFALSRTSTRLSSRSSAVVRGAPEYPGLKRVVQGAFSHRRKTLANSLELAGVASRERTVSALAALGRPAGERAESLTPDEFPQLARLLA